MSLRIAIVSSAATFGKRAGNAAYLASFCRALRAIGCRVDLIVFAPFSFGVSSVRLEPAYLTHVDSVVLRDARRLGDLHIPTNPIVWTRATARQALRAADRVTRRWRGLEPRRPGLLKLDWPTDDEVRWTREKIAALGSDVVVANYLNASRIFEPGRPGALRMILTHDVFALRRQSFLAAGLPLDIDERMIGREAEAFASADLCVTITADEAAFIERAHRGVPTVVFPYVTEVASTATSAAPSEICLFVGADNDPNRRAVDWLVREVWPRVLQRVPAARLRIVGAVRTSESLPRHRGVELAGPVSDLAGEYAAAAVAVVPLPAGSGLKIKLVEALAHGVPVVATTAGSAGVTAVPGGPVMVADDPDGFASAITAELTSSDHDARRSAARTFALAHFAPAVGGEALRRALAAAMVPTR